MSGEVTLSFLLIITSLVMEAFGGFRKERPFIETRWNNIKTNPFIQLVESGDPFVDKSLFIKDFLELGTNWHRARQLVIPPKFGKTMNLRMLEHFLSIQVDEEGKEMDPNQTAAYRLFVLGQTASGRRMNFNIAKHKYIIEKHLAHHLVVYISFKGVKGSTLKEVYTGFHRVILDAYRRYSFIQSVSVEKELCSWDTMSESLKFYSLKSTFDLLTYQIGSYFHRKVHVLWDDHDEPLRSLLTTNLSQGDFDQIARLMVEIGIKTLGAELPGRHHDCVGDILITGALMLYHDGYKGYHFNERLNAHDMRDNEFGKYFGFTVEETNALFDAHVPSKELRDRAKEFYFGYRVEDGSIEFYNPYDIVNFIRNGRVSDYWMQATALPQGLLDIKGVKGEVVSLLSGGVAVKDWRRIGFHDGRDTFSVPDLKNLRLRLRGISEDPWNRDSWFYFGKFLLTMGYLVEIEGSWLMTLANEEIALGLTTRVLQWYVKEYNVPLDARERVIKEFGRLKKSNETFQLKTSLEILFSYFLLKNGSADELNRAVQSCISSVLFLSKLAFPRGKLKIETDPGIGNIPSTSHLHLLDEHSNVGLIISVKNAFLQTTDIDASCFGKQTKRLRVRQLNIKLSVNKSIELIDKWITYVKHTNKSDTF